MARTEARIHARIWRDDEFRALGAGAQYLYLLLLSQHDLSLCGVIAYSPKRWAALSAGATPGDVDAWAYELARARFVVIDESTDELWVRSFIKNDGVLQKPNVAVGMSNAWTQILSPAIRLAVVRAVGDIADQDVLPWERMAEPFRKGFVERFEKTEGLFPPPPIPPSSSAPADVAPGTVSDEPEAWAVEEAKRRLVGRSGAMPVVNPSAWLDRTARAIQREGRNVSALGAGVVPCVIPGPFPPLNLPDPEPLDEASAKVAEIKAQLRGAALQGSEQT